MDDLFTQVVFYLLIPRYFTSIPLFINFRTNIVRYEPIKIYGAVPR